ncbi:hypothetical protein WEI85_42275 [Actinomycetes bacterium KLBMP 9797]
MNATANPHGDANGDSQHEQADAGMSATTNPPGDSRDGEAQADPSTTAAADWLLRVGARHWPGELRAPLLREWRAELATLARDTDLGPVSRTVRQLRFALSLAASPPARGELLFGAGRAVQPILMLLAVPLLCQALTFGLPKLGEMLLERGAAAPWAYRMVSIAGLVVSAVLFGLAGGWLGRRLPVRGTTPATPSVPAATPATPSVPAATPSVPAATPTTPSVLATALIAPLVLAAGFAVIGWAQWASLPDDPGDGTVVTVAPVPVAASLWWGVALAALAAAVLKLRRWRWLAAGAGGLLLFDVAGVFAGWHLSTAVGVPRAGAPWWFFQSFQYDRLTGDAVPMVVAQTVWPLLVATAFVARYIAAARHAPEPIVAPEAEAPRHQRLGLGVIAAGLALWGCASAALPGRIAAVAVVDEVLSWELMLWAHELRQAAIVVAVLGLVVALAGRAAVWPVALLAGAALLAVDAVVDRSDGAGPIALSGGVAIVAAAWWLGGASPARASGRRHLAQVAVVAAFCAPGLFFQTGWHGTVPAAFPVLTGVVVATALTVAGLTAVAARPRPVRPGTRIAVVAGPVVLAVALVTVGFGYAFALGLPFVAYYLAVLAPDRSRFARVATPVAAVLLAVPVAYLQLMPAQLVGGPLMAAAGYGTPVDGLPIFAGVVAMAIPLAALFGRRAHTQDQGVPHVALAT